MSTGATRSLYSPITWVLATLLGPQDRRCAHIILFRSLWAGIFLYGLEATVALGTSPAILTVGALLGVSLATHLAYSRLSTTGFLVTMVSVSLLYSACVLGAAELIGNSSGHFFTVNIFDFHGRLTLLVTAIAALTTWFFWRVRIAITLEAILLAAISITVFAGHRGFHFNRPKIVNTLAWQLRVDHLTMLLTIGSALLIASALYVAIASRTSRPLTTDDTLVIESSGQNIPLGAILVAAILGVIAAVQYTLYQHFSSSMLARVANGVGMESSPGVSPLTFQSALGSTNQPSALVRLEGDYSSNPFTPMLYLRESSLSAFNGKEMVNAGRAYDADVPGSTVNDAYTGKEDPDLQQRTPVIHSVFPLADHTIAFGIDYPLSIVQLKNPKPNRFKASYRVYSSAPGFSLTEIENAEVGDSRWSEDVRQHYLVTHPDERYRDLAQKVTSHATTPVQKVQAIVAHLNKTAIYTLTPHHEVKPEDDQVAPFLFGDHRGYCVHFAHAVVYMARSIGIPARIGTGYLTDLSQSKDGHILLLMSDRHAWPEVYVQKYGWLPFDVQPEQVESHADNKVDAKLLEELMGMIDPGEELHLDDAIKDEPNVEEPSKLQLPDLRTVLSVLAGLCVCFVLLKTWLVLGWRLFSDPSHRAKYAYLSSIACLEDVGVCRAYGETRSEFALRAAGGATAGITQLVLRRAYGDTDSSAFSPADVDKAQSLVGTYLKNLPWWKRLLGAVNPSSVLSWLSGGRW